MENAVFFPSLMSETIGWIGVFVFVPKSFFVGVHGAILSPKPQTSIIGALIHSISWMVACVYLALDFLGRELTV